MQIDIATLFPEMCDAVLQESILGRAQKSGAISVQCWNIRDYTLNKHKRVDDVPYGGGRGMVMQADPIYRCWEAVCAERESKPHCIYLSPKGSVFTQQKAVANTYVLQNQEGKVGFYKVMAGSEPTIKPYRAYINADVAEANIVALLLPGIGTGIDGIVAEDALVNVYDLNGILVRENVKLGQALEGLSKGIYIVNGTKKAVK